MKLKPLSLFVLSYNIKEICCILLTYRSPQNYNKILFFEEIANLLNKMTGKYDNVLLTGYLKIDPLDKSKDTNNRLSDLCHTFYLTQSAIQCSKLAIETLEQGVKYVHS